MKHAFFFLTLVCIVVLVGLTTFRSTFLISIGSFGNIQPSVTTPIVTSYPTSISFVGDVFLGRRVETLLKTYGTDYVYSLLPTIHSSTTVVVGNFEGAIPEVHHQTPEMTMNFSIDEAYIPSLAQYGFTYMSLANNHSYDKGTEGFLNTQKVLADAHIQPFGHPKGIATSTVAYVQLENTTIALVGIHTLQSVPPQKELEMLMETISKQSDFQIAFVHWGTEYTPVHTKQQERFAQLLVDVGFDTIIGAHPHVVQDIALYKGVPIFYSLGNFIFDQYFSLAVQQGLWVDLSFDTNEITYTLYGITSIGSQSVPRFMSAYENDLFLQSLAKKSSTDLQPMILDGLITLPKKE